MNFGIELLLLMVLVLVIVFPVIGFIVTIYQNSRVLIKILLVLGPDNEKSFTSSEYNDIDAELLPRGLAYKKVRMTVKQLIPLHMQRKNFTYSTTFNATLQQCFNELLAG